MRFPKVVSRINKVGAFICGAIIFGGAILAVMESILRKVFSSPTPWSLNLTQGFFIWAAFLGSAWAFESLGHVSVDMFRDIIDKRTKGKKRIPRRILSIIGYLISATVVSFILWGGIVISERAIRLDSLANYNFRFPVIISHTAITVGSAMMLLTLVFIIIDLATGGDKFM